MDQKIFEGVVASEAVNATKRVDGQVKKIDKKIAGLQTAKAELQKSKTARGIQAAEKIARRLRAAGIKITVPPGLLRAETH